MFLDDTTVSYWGVLIAAIVYFILGAIWYSPFLFGRHKERYDERVEEPETQPLNKMSSYIGEFIISLIIAYVLATFIEVSQAIRVIDGITIAFWVWIGFIATTHFSAVLWARKTIKHFFIHASFMLVGLLAMGAIIMSFS